MNPILVLGLVTLASGQIKTNDPNTKFFQLPLVDENTSNLLWGGALGAGATLLGQQLLGNNNNNNNPCGGFGRRRRQAGDEPNKKIFGLFENNNCNQGYQQPTNPCGRKKRQTKGVDTGAKVDTKFFGLENLFGGNSNNCGYTGNYNQPQSNLGYQQPTNQGYQNGYNEGYNSGFQNGASSSSGSSQVYNQGSSQGYNQGSIQSIRICQCSNYSKKDKYGYEEAKCQK